MSDQGNVGNVNFGVGVGRVDASEFEQAGKRAAESFGKGFQQAKSGLLLPPGSGQKATSELKPVEEKLSRIDKQLQGLEKRGELTFINDPKKAIQDLKSVEQALTDLSKLDKRIALSVDTVQLRQGLKVAQQLLIEQIGTARSSQSSLTQFEAAELTKRQKNSQVFINNIRGQFIKGAQSLAKLQDEAGLFDAKFSGKRQKDFGVFINNIRGQFIKGAQELSRVQEKAGVFDQQFLAKRQKEFAQFANNIHSIFVKGAQAQLKAQEALGKQLAQAIERTPQGAGARQVQNFAFAKQAAEASGLTVTTGKLSAAFTKLGQQQGIVGKFGNSLAGVFGKAEAGLSKFGLSISDVSILLGAGFAGGIAGAIQVGIKLAEVFAKMAEATIKFLFSAAQLGAEVQHLRAQTAAAFGPEAAAEVLSWAQTTAQSLGLSEKAALTLAGKIALLFQSFGSTGAESLTLSQGLIASAAVFQRVTPGAGSFSDVLTTLKGALTGNVEALRELGVAVNETTLRNTAAAHGVQGLTGEIDAATKSILAELFVLDQANARLEKFGSLTDSQATTQDKLTASFEDLKTRIGEDLAPTLLAATEAGLDFVAFLEGALDDLRKFNKESPEFAKALKIIAGFEFSNLKRTFDLLGKIIKGALDQLSPFVKAWVKLAEAIEFVIDILPGGTEELSQSEKKSKEAAEASREFAAAQRAIADATAAATQKLRETRQAVGNSIEGIEQRIEASKKLDDAIRDAERSENDAELRLSRTHEDNARKIEDANRDVSRAYRDRNRAIADANEKLAKAIESRERSIFDARRNLADIDLRTKREVQDAERRLRDFRIDNARKIIDAERKLSEIRRQNAFDIVSSFRAVQDAQAEGDVQAERSAAFALSQARRGGDVKDAQVAIDRARADSARELDNLKRDLARKEFDRNRDLKEAQLRLNRAIIDGDRDVAAAKEDLRRTFEDTAEKIADALRNLTNVQKENARALFDAANNLAEVQRKNKEAVEEAILAQQRLNDSFFLSVLTLQELNNQLEIAKNAIESTQFPTSGEDPSRFGNEGNRRVHGGPVLRGRPYFVGEGGRTELFIPKENGQVISNKELINALRGMNGGGSGSGSSSSPTIIVNEANRDPEEIAFAVMARMASGSKR